MSTTQQPFLSTPIPAYRPCPHCEDGTVYRSQYGGNDPDVWPEPCPDCHGEGEIPRPRCDFWGCTAEATETLDFGDGPNGHPQTEDYCATHAAEIQAEEAAYRATADLP